MCGGKPYPPCALELDLWQMSIPDSPSLASILRGDATCALYLLTSMLSQSETTVGFSYRILVIYTALAIEHTLRSQVLCKGLSK